jgi:hypothetical protein
MFYSILVPLFDRKVIFPPRVVAAYGVFLGFALSVWHFIANGEFSAILTMAEMLQSFALITLAMQVLSSGNATGISARSLGLEAAALCCRLSSTTWLNGYLPVDASGDWLYQAVDMCSVVVVGWLLYQVLVVHRRTYQADKDSEFGAGEVAVACLVLAGVLHADMNSRPLFDSLWMAGLFLGTVAVLPQLFLITRTGGKVEALTSHYIAMMAMGRLLSGMFMWHARNDITCAPWIKGYNHAVFAILLAHFVHLALLGDFAYLYVKTVVTKGLQARLEIEGLADCV